MKAKIYSFMVMAFAVLLISSCNKSNDDASLIFSVHRTGGWVGLDENIKINAGATSYSIRYLDLFTHESKSYQTTIKTPDELWAYLIKSFDLDTFTNIKDGPCRACLDGYDETISVIINGKTYSFYNGVIDGPYQEMQDFFDIIFKQIEDFEIIAKFRE